MWVGHFKIFHENCVNLTYTRRYEIVDSIYPLTTYFSGNYMHISSLHLLSGREAEKKKFIRAFSADPRVVEIEGECTDFFFSHVKTKKTDRHTFTFYDPRLFFLRPVIHTDREDWLVGAWEKTYLQQIYRNWQKYFDVEVISIGREKVSEVFLPNLTPALTAKQKEALELAASMGYYDYPRRVYLEQMARKLGISRISLQERLHKAESKILPRLLKTG